MRMWVAVVSLFSVGVVPVARGSLLRKPNLEGAFLVSIFQLCVCVMHYTSGLLLC